MTKTPIISVTDTDRAVASEDPVSTTSQAPVSTTAQAYDTVRRAIINAELSPGTYVSQVQLAAQLNISRTPLREALRRLQSEGLLEGDFNRRLRVAPLSVDDLEQVAAMRIMLESFGVEASVPKLDSERLDRAAEALRQMDRTLSDPESYDAFHVPHRIFHTALFSAVGPRMRSQLEELWDHAERYRAYYRQSASDALALASIAHDEHASIMRSAWEGDAVRCGNLSPLTLRAQH
ncbi:GntR family transcriptional regulator [Mycolicibacter algericus]|uniref:GntR family transcriptional regulator n=1 Tax=Mycolicibacter algericus TaxID=1288388 RepID=A0A7I9YAE4_MYCAL|nr:GntR family transcriptional regulator [Mycolicibacter algericus]GFG85600.1 GntR family transcriptional regulator [Mycolicibacter algericus]